MSNFLNPNKRLILWNKLGSSEEVNNSIVGFNGIATGGAYIVGKFGTGFLSDANSEYITFTNILNNLTDIGSIELWLVPKSTFDDGSTDRYIWSSIGADSFLFYDASANQWNFTIGGQSAVLSDTNVPDDIPIHIACLWNNSVTNKVRIIVDGVEGTPSTISFTSINDTDIRIGNNDANNAFASSVLDNIKIYNYDESNVSNREIEYPIEAGIEFGKSNIFVNPNKRLILWNKLGSTEEVEKSRVGNNGIEGSAVTYSTGKFNNGILANAINKEVKFDNIGNTLIGSGLARTIEYWFKPSGYSITNGQASLGSHWHLSLAIDVNNFFDFSINTSGILWRIRVTGMYYGFGNTSYQPSGFNIGDGINAHIALVMNPSGIDGSSDTCRVYLNGIMFLNTTSILTIANGMTTFWFGDYILSPGTQTPNAVLDNLKIYNYTKTDFSDRDIEYPIKINGTNIFNNPIRQLVLWNKLGSTEEVEKSNVGGNLIISGSPVFGNAKFLNGVNTGTEPQNGTIDCKDALINTSGTIEGWYKPSYDSSNVNYYYVFGKSTLASYGVHILQYYNGNWRFLHNNALEVLTYAASFSSGDLIHLALVWDDNGIDGGANKASVYLNGSAIINSTTTRDLVDWDGYYRIGGHNGLTRGSNGYIDNLKIYNYAKTDFSDREIEYPIDLKHLITI